VTGIKGTTNTASRSLLKFVANSRLLATVLQGLSINAKTNFVCLPSWVFETVNIYRQKNAFLNVKHCSVNLLSSKKIA